MFDPWEHLGPKRRRLLELSWASVFRELPRDLLRSQRGSRRVGVGHATEHRRPEDREQLFVQVLSGRRQRLPHGRRQLHRRARDVGVELQYAALVDDAVHGHIRFSPFGEEGGDRDQPAIQQQEDRQRLETETRGLVADAEAALDDARPAIDELDDEDAAGLRADVEAVESSLAAVESDPESLRPNVRDRKF